VNVKSFNESFPPLSGGGFKWTNETLRSNDMKSITAIIEKGEDEARQEFESCLHEQAAYMKERTGVTPKWYSEKIRIEYKYDMTAFFLTFPFINVTEFAKSVDINPSLMRKYKSGLVKAGAKQKDQIQHKFDDILSRLSIVKF